MSILRLSGVAPVLAGPTVTSWAPDHLDLSGLEAASPFDVVTLAVIWTRLEGAGKTPTVELPEDPVARANLFATGLADVIPGDWPSAGDQPVQPPLLRLLRLASAEDWDFLLADLWPEVAAALDDPRPAFEILSELIDNAATHGQSPAGTFVCARSYDGGEDLMPGLWLAIGDGGPGIPAHLRLNPKYKEIAEDERLIQLARRPWVTGTRDRRGWGLVEVFEEASALGVSELLIRSGGGEGFFRLRAALRPFAMYRPLRPKVPGTWIHLRVGGS
jgi:hypothetical protein